MGASHNGAGGAALARTAAAAVLLLAAALVSLAMPPSPSFDPFAWLV